ncbi:DUF2225 domain-containing protein [Clostridium sp. CX1]|uniref:DUF2225 domain-containing protein n=1 Tax=Clostridium sp. CX1 TaxID=2978346 RepID=UPI0021C23F1A|nr:DUF2225 domain-containing protein [Clostridium sp. CX1]MCT8975838.1 DUF2225 domain-containing protein [Clostridium sp. CX1]
MSNNIFSGLENLGFDDVSSVNLYKKEEEDKTPQLEEKSEDDKIKSLLYDRQVTCPVCESSFKARSVKTSAYRIEKQDSDFFIKYALINPYFYDVWVCSSCGYSAMKNDFSKIRNYQCDAIKEKITSRWTGKTYPEVYDINIAIERYKLSLLSYYVIEAKASKKAMNCLKLAWMYRILGDEANELTFIKQALEGFNDAFFNEDFPLYGMDKFTSMYLIGELNRRVGNDDEALNWFSKVVATPGASSKIKDKCRDQRDLIKELQSKNSTDNIEDVSEEDDKKNKKGFFSRFFK